MDSVPTPTQCPLLCTPTHFLPSPTNLGSYACTSFGLRVVPCRLAEIGICLRNREAKRRSRDGGIASQPASQPAGQGCIMRVHLTYHW